MIGFPSHINNRFDLDYCKSEYAAETKQFLLDLMTAKDNWFPTGALEDASSGINDTAHKVVEHKDTEGKVTEIVQFELIEDLNGPLIKQYGFANYAEAQAYIDSIKV